MVKLHEEANRAKPKALLAMPDGKRVEEEKADKSAEAHVVIKAVSGVVKGDIILRVKRDIALVPLLGERTLSKLLGA